MALFKIFKGSDSSKITDSSVTGYKVPVDGYAYYDTSTRLFYIDAAYGNGNTITRQPINAYHAESATVATLAVAAEYDDISNRIADYYGHTLEANGNTIGLVNGSGNNVGNTVMPIPYIVGTGSTAGTWLGSCSTITSYTDGLLILYKPSIAGADTTTLNINSLGAKTIYTSNSNKLTTHYPANQPILLVYSTSQNSGCWMCIDFYDSDTRQKTYRSSTNVELPIAGINTSNSATAAYSAISSGSSKAVYAAIPNTVANVATINPSTGKITVPGGIVGNLTGTADTAVTLSTDAGGDRTPIYFSNGLPTAGEITFDTLTANRLMWTKVANQPYAGDHYVSSTKIAINSTSEPTTNLYISGTTKGSGNATFDTLTISNTGIASHLTFSRSGSWNYITVPFTSNETVLSLNSSTGTANSYYHWTPTAYLPGNATNTRSLGDSTYRWKDLFIGTANSYGNATTPIYWDNGVPKALSYTIQTSVPANAVFTDTNNKVTQTNTTASNDYRILLSNSANDTTETAGSNKNTNLRFNPGTQTLSVGGSISMTGNLTVTGNANFDSEVQIDSLSANSLLINGNSSFVQIPVAPTPEASSNDTSVATTAFVKSAISSGVPAHLAHTLTIGSYTFDGSADVTIPIYNGNITNL